MARKNGNLDLVAIFVAHMYWNWINSMTVHADGQNVLDSV